MTSRHSKGFSPKTSFQDWRTPPILFKNIERAFGVRFSIDLASSNENHLCKAWLTKADNTLSLTPQALGERIHNSGGVAYLNPPYNEGNLGEWIRLLGAACQEFPVGGCALLPNNKTDQKWWSQIIEAFNPSIGFIYPRVQFIGATRKPRSNPNHGSLVLGFGLCAIKGNLAIGWKE